MLYFFILFIIVFFYKFSKTFYTFQIYVIYKRYYSPVTEIICENSNLLRKVQIHYIHCTIQQPVAYLYKTNKRWVQHSVLYFNHLTLVVNGISQKVSGSLGLHTDAASNCRRNWTTESIVKLLDDHLRYCFRSRKDWRQPLTLRYSPIFLPLLGLYVY